VQWRDCPKGRDYEQICKPLCSSANELDLIYFLVWHDEGESSLSCSGMWMQTCGLSDWLVKAFVKDAHPPGPKVLMEGVDAEGMDTEPSRKTAWGSIGATGESRPLTIRG